MNITITTMRSDCIDSKVSIDMNLLIFYAHREVIYPNMKSQK